MKKTFFKKPIAIALSVFCLINYSFSYDLPATPTEMPDIPTNPTDIKGITNSLTQASGINQAMQSVQLIKGLAGGALIGAAANAMSGSTTDIGSATTNIDGNQGQLDVSSTGISGKSGLLDSAKGGYDKQCIDYSILGVCVWMTVTPPPFVSIKFDYSSIVQHYSPDAIVEVFSSKKKLPSNYSKLNNKLAGEVGNTLYKAVSKMLFNSAFSIGGGSSESGGFYNAHIMGNPLISVQNQSIGNLLGTMGYCTSDVTPFMSYYHSDLDPEWRMGWAEMIKALNPLLFMNDVRDGSHDWGNLHPRTGWTNNASPLTSAAIVAARAGDLVTSDQSGKGDHLAHKLPDSNMDGHVLLNGKVNDKDGRWKVLFPKGLSNKCQKLPFPQIDTVLGTNEIKSSSRRFVLQMWRKYRCCKRKGQRFIAAISTNPQDMVASNSNSNSSK